MATEQATIEDEGSSEILEFSNDSSNISESTTLTESTTEETLEAKPAYGKEPEPKKTKEKKPPQYVLHAEGEYAKEPILRMGGKSNIDLSKVQILTLLSGGHRYKYIKTQVRWS